MLTFYKHWLKQATQTTQKPNKILYNLTSITYHGKNLDTAQHDYNHNHQPSPNQLRTTLPTLNRHATICLALNGNITDIKTLKTTLQFFKNFEATPNCLMMDRGFCSSTNLSAMFEEGYTFLQAIRVNANWIYNIIDAPESLRFSPDSKLTLGERTYYASTVNCWWVRTKKLSGKQAGQESVLVHICSGSSMDRYVNRDVGVEVLAQYRCRVFVLFCVDLVGGFHDLFMDRLKVEHDRLVGDEKTVVLAEFEKYFRVYREKYVRRRCVEYGTAMIAQHKAKMGGLFVF